MKLSAIIVLPSLFLTHSYGHVIKHQHLRRVPSAASDVDAAVASHMAIYTDNNAVVAAQEASLLALQKSWDGTNGDAPTAVVAAAANVPTPAEAEPPVITVTSSVQDKKVEVASASSTSPAETEGSASSVDLAAASAFSIKAAAVDHQVSSASAASIPTTITSVPTVPTVPSSTSTSTSSVVIPSAETPSSVTLSDADSGSDSGSGSGSGSGAQYTGPATPQGAMMPNACGITVDGDEMAAAIPQWLFDSGRDGMQPSPLCGKYLTVIGHDGNSYQAKVVDRCGPGGGQRTSNWLDMSASLYTATTGNSEAGSDSPGYPEVSWSVPS